MARDNTRYSQNQRFEVILDNGEDATRWSDLLGNVTTIVSGTEHITAAKSVSFDKVAGISADGYIIRPLDVMNGMDLDAFSSEGQILSSVYFSSIADISSYNIALLMSSGTEGGVFYNIPDTDFSVGWNHLLVDCASYTTQSGSGADWKKVKYLGVGVTLDDATKSLSSILVDSVRIQMPTATFNFDPNIENVTAQSEVQIKHGNDADELSVDAANTARTTATNVIPVQEVDSTGKVSPAGELATNAPFTALTDGTNTAAIDAADTARTTATIVQATQPIDAQGNVISGGGGTSGGLTLYSSPVHFTAVYQSATALDLSGMAFSITNFSQFVDIEAWDASGDFIAKYTPKTHRFAWDSVNDRVTVTGAAFVTGGTYKVSILAPDRTISLPDDSAKVLVGNRYPLVSDDIGIALISSAQDITTSWADLGPEISTFGFNSLGVWLEQDQNLAFDFRLRAVAKHTSAGSEEYPLNIETVSSTQSIVRVSQYFWEFNEDSDANNILTISTNGIVPYVQFQVMARVAGGTAGQIDTAYYTRGWR